MTVLVADTAVRTMDNKFRVLITCNFTSCVNGLLLSLMYGGGSLITGSFDSLSILVGNYVLVFT